MPPFRHCLTSLFGKAKTTINIIVIGIDYPSFSLVSKLKKETPQIQVCAFIDEEPWTNKTQILGVTVYYPSDLLALINKHNVALVLYIEGQKPTLSPNLIKAIQSSNATLIQYQPDAPIEDQLKQKHL